MPTTAAGLFIGWRLERGLRYRKTLYIADYDLVRKGNFSWKSVRSVPEEETFFPSELCFPFAEARKLAITTMADPVPPAPAPVIDFPLPFDAEAKPDVSVHAPPHEPRFKITMKRMVEYDATPGCKACQDFQQRGHTPECRERFRTLLAQDGVIPTTTKVVEPADPPGNYLHLSPEEEAEAVEASQYSVADLFGDFSEEEKVDEALSIIDALDLAKPATPSVLQPDTSAPSDVCALAPPEPGGGCVHALHAAPGSGNRAHSLWPLSTRAHRGRVQQPQSPRL